MSQEKILEEFKETMKMATRGLQFGLFLAIALGIPFSIFSALAVVLTWAHG